MHTQEFINYIQKVLRYSPCTVSSYRKNLTYFSAYLLSEGLTFADVRPSVVANWVQSLMEKGLQPKTVNQYLSSIRSYFDFCCRFKGLKTNPALQVKDVRTPKVLPKFIPEEKINYLIDNLLPSNDFKRMRTRIIILVFYHCGLRCAEFAGLQDEDISLEKDYLRVLGKGNKERFIPFGHELHNEICRYIAMRDAVITHAQNGFFLKTIDGLNLTAGQIRIVTKLALCRIVAPELAHPHTLRHTFATVLMNHGASLLAVKTLLGHSSVETTAIYEHVSIKCLHDTYNIAFKR